MKTSTFQFLVALILLFFSACGSDDEPCGSNGEVSGGCFDAVLNAYNVQNIFRSSATFTRENIFIAYQFEGTQSERYEIRARANQYDEQDLAEDGVNYVFEEGRAYNEDMMTFNGNINAPTPGVLIVTFSKVDRENGLVSGFFTWLSASTGETTSNLTGTFVDVAVALEPN
ncbi:MAG: hypothetical protein AAF789_03900 [Bacteroidota bacterium]